MKLFPQSRRKVRVVVLRIVVAEIRLRCRIEVLATGLGLRGSRPFVRTVAVRVVRLTLRVPPWSDLAISDAQGRGFDCAESACRNRGGVPEGRAQSLPTCRLSPKSTIAAIRATLAPFIDATPFDEIPPTSFRARLGHAPSSHAQKRKLGSCSNPLKA